MTLERDPLGRNAVLYWDTTLIAGTTATEINSWLATASIAGDVYDESDNLEPEYADITTRRKAAGGFDARKPVIRQGEATFDFSWETNNVSEPFVQALIDASNNLTRLGLVFLDYAINDPNIVTGEIAQGLAGNFYLSFTKTAAIRDAQRGSATAVLADNGVWHQYIES